VSQIWLIGHPVAHSLSPAMHNAAFDKLGLPHRYTVRDVTDAQLGATLDRLRRADVLGANVTIPHKEAALRLVDEASDEARRIGAVNTIVRRGERLIGDNTDRIGFHRGLESAGILEISNVDVLVLGAGGAARALVQQKGWIRCLRTEESLRQRIAEAQRLRRVGEAGHELVADRLLDEDALACGAALSGAQVAADDGAFHRFADVRVGEHDDGAVPAQLEHHVLSRGPARHRGAGLGGADKPDAIHELVPGDLVADLGARPGDQVERAVRKVRLGHAFHQGDGDHARG